MFIFSYPKPWNDAFYSIQKAAIQSWKEALPDAVIVLLGNEYGTASASEFFNICFDPCCGNKGKNEWDTPLVSAIFDTINRITPLNSTVCYINADIVIGPEFRETIQTIVQSVNEKEWLLVGKRTDIDLQNVKDLSTLQIRENATTKGKDHGWSGIDYFVFPSGTFKFVYPFALGKFVWDQWLVGNAFRRGILTVDGSLTIFAVHLNCDWYFRGTTTNNRQSIYDSEESIRNRSFDYYQKTILSGTTHITKLNEKGIIQIQKKEWIQDE